MTGTADVARARWPGVTIAHCRHPPWEARDGVQAAAPGSIAIGYNGQRGVVIQAASGRLTARDLPRGSIRLNGPEPALWLRVNHPAEVLEVTADPASRRAIAEALDVGAYADLGEVYGWEDRLAWAILARLRSGIRGLQPMTDVERDQLVRRLYEQVYWSVFGGRAPDRPAADRGLDARRLRRVTEHVEAAMHRPLTIAALADAAAYSPFHFARAFKKATGLAPHQFVTARRIERARALLLETGRSVEAIAAAVGFSNRSHFRRLFLTQVGALPSALRAQHRGE
ncbi:helix-turn-helix domain-containing protein [Plastoroseomonas hellenica]|uniref:helix-turn-helix domain-containing protein n=1 Tax=Plastoroseomonas hellenica TaxID=2687306 RepID=UPI001BAD0986|nr:AraC family transcriptional regulator [Plastoroseomonas hellenica]MBR0642014.1 helix-turn-helix transcriptional regulator [Plastoroseomonas hellenica]